MKNSILENIDYKKTVDNARKVLEKYQKLHIIEKREAIQASVISDLPGSGSHDNATENQNITRMEATQFCSIVRYVISEIENDIYRMILTDVYITDSDYTGKDVINHITTSHNDRFSQTQYYRKKNAALYCFAQLCPPIQLDGDSYTDLLVKEK